MPHDYVIDKLFPVNRVHLLAGISSAGKSRFIGPALIMWAAGLPIMGLRGYPVPWCMVCRDRPLQDAKDMLRRMGFTDDDMPIIPAFGAHAKPQYQIMEAVKACGAQVVLWEGFDLMVKHPNNPHEVDEFLGSMSAYCEQGLTIIGTVGVAKLKPHEMYQNPRQLVAGSSVWERSTSSNLIILTRNPRNVEDGRRVLFACLKNEPSFTVSGQFNESGILEFDNWEDRLSGDTLERVVSEMRGKQGQRGLIP